MGRSSDLATAVARLYGQLEFCGADWRKDLRLVLSALEAAQRDAERLRVEIDRSRMNYERSIQILTAIYAVMSPPHIKLDDGRTMEFVNPKIEHLMLHELSERIRAIPGEIAAIDAQLKEKP